MSKKSYMHLLKEAIAEFDTSDTVEVKGPMLDPIIAWSGDGELPTYKDAASILERYYFNENAEEKLKTLDEAPLPPDQENDKGKKSATASKHTEGPGGEEQAGTADASTIRGMEKEQEKDIAKEDVDLSEDEWTDKNVPKKKKYTDEHTNESVDAFFEALETAILEDDDEDDEDADDEDEKDEKEDEKEDEAEEEMEEGLELENAIIEKLIDEMEDLDEEDKQTSMPKEKKAKGPEEDAQGAGTEQAGTGVDDGQVPPRKDLHDKMVNPKKYSDEHVKESEGIDDILNKIVEDIDLDEAELSGQANAVAQDAGSSLSDEDMEDIDLDEVGESSAVPGGPSPHKAGSEGEDWDEGRYYEESKDVFQLFKEAIEEDEDEIDPDDIRV